VEPDRGVHPLGHPRRLQARRPTAAVTRVVQEAGGQRGGQPASAGLRHRRDVVDPAVTGVVERHRRSDGRAVEAGDEDVKGRLIDAGEQARRHVEYAQVLRPVGWAECHLRPGDTQAVERDTHRPGGLVDRVATRFEVAAHRLITLVHPGGEAGHTRRGVRGLHCFDGLGAHRGR
jgi:hypothetical protein